MTMDPQEKVRVIIDTDIGGDPDDATAIALAVASPELHIEGITTVYSDVDYHARRVSKLLRLAGAGPIPIYNGLSETLVHNRNVWKFGRPAEIAEAATRDWDMLDGDPTPDNAGHAVSFLVRTIMDNPGRITVVGIGPLTNIAAAIVMEPRIVHNVKELILMGGVTRLGSNAAELPEVEYNIACDPEAASVVFSSGMPIVMVGLDVTYQACLTREECARLIATGKPANAALADVIERWLQRIGQARTPMHDPLALALAIDRTLVETRKARVQVEYDHREDTGRTVAILDPDGTVDVCVDVDGQRFLHLLMDRLCEQA